MTMLMPKFTPTEFGTRFIAAWKRAVREGGSLADVARAMEMSVPTAGAYATRMRARGVHLAKFKAGRKSHANRR